jgi:hypothetical protein
MAGYGTPAVGVVRRRSPVRHRAAPDDERPRLHWPSIDHLGLPRIAGPGARAGMARSCRSCRRRSRLPPTSPSISRADAASSSASIIRCPANGNPDMPRREPAVLTHRSGGIRVQGGIVKQAGHWRTVVAAGDRVQQRNLWRTGTGCGALRGGRQRASVIGMPLAWNAPCVPPRRAGAYRPFVTVLAVIADAPPRRAGAGTMAGSTDAASARR